MTDAAAIAKAVRSGATSARETTRTTLDFIAASNPAINAFTAITADQALADADAIDRDLAAGRDPGPLCGVPFAAKNLFDVAGLVTLAGSIIEKRRPPATNDAFCVKRLREAGGICVGALNMDEYAYGFTTENSHYGAVRNPHDLTRIAGGSSGGSGAAVAAGMVPLAMGTDTNGSIRVPASLNGVFGIKPTYGRLSRAGSVMFVPSLDHIGPLARTVADLACVYDILQGPDPEDPAQANRPIEKISDKLGAGIAGLRIARLGGYFSRNGLPVAQEATAQIAAALGATEKIELPDAAAARAAAYLITAAEGAHLRLPDLRTRPQDFEPFTLDRLLAGALIPAQWVLHAQRVRGIFSNQVKKIFADWDILIAPATPTAATVIGQDTLEIDGEEIPLRPNYGVYTQPISCIGLPVLTVPIQNADGKLPIGVQLIAAPWAEEKLFRAAAFLEREGICAAPVAKFRMET